MQLAPLLALSEEEIRLIHESSLDILESCGVRVLSPRLLQALGERGLAVDQEARTVRFGRGSIEDALASIPRRFEVFDREGRALYSLGEGPPRVASGHNAVNWVDSGTGRTRPSTVEDVAFFARICQELEHIDMIGIPAMPQDAPRPEASLLYGIRAVIENSTKPVFFSTDNAGVNRAAIELCRRAFRGDLSEQVYGITQLSSTSPLYWEQGVSEAILDTLDTGVPIALLPEPIAGISAPYTLAGLLTVHNAECLSGLAMIQLLRPGAKVMYGSSWTASNMRNGAALVGSVETSVCRVAGAQLAARYGVPSHTTAPNSDNHAHDEQSSWEKTLSMLSALASGNDLVVNCGMFATGMTCSHEQLLMDAEITACCRRLVRGVRVDRETVAADLIKERGPQGESYLTAEHTLRWLYAGEHLTPVLSVSGPFSTWQAEGSPDTYELARRKVSDYGARTAAPALDGRRKDALAEVLAAFRVPQD